jgi:diguanylate cyclase (GGDEF)-like protein
LQGLSLSFRTKVTVITLLIVLGCQAGTVAVLLFATNRSVNQSADDDLNSGVTVYRSLLSTRSELLEQKAAALAQRLLISDMVDPALTAEELARDAEAIDADLAFLLDQDGKLLASNTPIDADATAFVSLTTHNHNVSTIGPITYELLSHPVGSKNGLHWAGVGFAIDNELAMELAQVIELDVTFMKLSGTKNYPELIASSLTSDERTSLLNHMVGVYNGEGHDDTVGRLRQEYRAKRVTFIPGRDDLFALLQKTNEEALAPYRSMRGSLLHGTSTGILFALILAFLLSRIATKDIQKLLRAARRIRVGNYDDEIDLPNKDEFGELAVAMNSMRMSIAEREERIRNQAEFDMLTGLPNRSKGLQIIDTAIAESKDTNQNIVVMVMHLARFREIQSSLGHEIGDEVLSQTAARIRSQLDDGITLARLEGDQFLIVAPNHNAEDGWKLVEEISRMIESGLNIKSINIVLDSCIGFCVYPQHGKRADQLLSHAAVAKDDALRKNNVAEAYKNGRDSRNFRRLTILGDLRRAALENELDLYLQPKANLTTRRICGAEALLRWNHPDLGEISPMEFIPLAESTGSIRTITEWVLCRSISYCERLQKAGIDMNIAVNISARDIEDGKLPDLIYHELGHHAMNPGCLTLEITEEAVVRHIGFASKMLNEFRMMGIRTSMDDFGIGYSSLSQLQQLPLDELKIDRTFVTNLPENKHNAAIAKAVIELAHDLDLEVVAEGVETAGALRWLQQHGCERAQGYLFSPPMPADDFIDWLKHWDKLTQMHSTLDLSDAQFSTLPTLVR